MIIKEKILSVLEVKDQEVKGKHSKEDLDKVKLSQSIYKKEISDKVKTKNFDLVSFEALARGEDKASDNSNDNQLYLDYLRIGEEEVQVSCQRAANVTITAQNEISYISAKLISQVTSTPGSIESMMDKNLYVEPPRLPTSEKTRLDENNQLRKVESPLNLTIGHTIDGVEINKPEVFESINKAYACLRSDILYNTLTTIEQDAKSLFTVELIITNRRVIRELVERSVKLRFTNSETQDILVKVGHIMDSLQDHFSVTPLTESKLTLGINMAKIDKSMNPNWTIDKEGRNFRTSNGVFMRIIQLKDTNADVPITMEKLSEIIPLLEKLELSFVKWAEDNVRISLGLRPLYENYEVPEITAQNQSISTALGLTKEESLSMRTDLMKEIKEFVTSTVSQMRDDINNDNMLGIK